MNEISVRLFYHLKEKAGTDSVTLSVNDDLTIRELKQILIDKFPVLQSHLDNILILVNNKVALDENQIPQGAQVSFLTPIGGG